MENQSNQKMYKIVDRILVVVWYMFVATMLLIAALLIKN